VRGYFSLPLKRLLNYNTKMSKCFKCGRYLGAKEEHMKMKTEKGKICYVCYNKYKAEQRHMSEDKTHKPDKTKT